MENQESILLDLSLTEAEASRVQKIIANTIDFILQMTILVLFYILIPTGVRETFIEYKPISTYLVVFVIITLYRLIFLLTANRTIGMMMCRIKYLNEEHQPLSKKEKITVALLGSTKKIKQFKA